MTAQSFQVLRPSRKGLRAGDIFVMQLPDLTYLFGRVISTLARWSVAEHSGTTNLVYVFRYRSASKELPPPAELRPENLLIPPQLVNRLGWSRGYFETIGSRPLQPEEVLPVHCFQTNIFRMGPKWFNEQAEPLSTPSEPIGQWSAGNYRTVEDSVCRALGITLAPD